MADDEPFRRIGGRGRGRGREMVSSGNGQRGPEVECFLGGGIVGLREAAGQRTLSGEAGRNHGHKEMESRREQR